jgi:hypothetical protein
MPGRCTLQLCTHSGHSRHVSPAPTRQRSSQSYQICRCATPVGRLAPLQISLQQSIDELEHAFGAPAECHSPSDQTQIHSNDPICASGSAQSSPHAAGSRASGRNIILLDGDCLESTTEHRAWVGTGLALMAALFTAGASQVHDVPSAAGSAAAVVSAFLTAGDCTMIELSGTPFVSGTQTFFVEMTGYA